MLESELKETRKLMSQLNESYKLLIEEYNSLEATFKEYIGRKEKEIYKPNTSYQ
jgi:hypothetical protein